VVVFLDDICGFCKKHPEHMGDELIPDAVHTVRLTTTRVEDSRPPHHHVRRTPAGSARVTAPVTAATRTPPCPPLRPSGSTQRTTWVGCRRSWSGTRADPRRASCPGHRHPRPPPNLPTGFIPGSRVELRCLLFRGLTLGVIPQHTPTTHSC